MASKLVALALALARSVFPISKPQGLCAFRTVRQISGKTDGGVERNPNNLSYHHQNMVKLAKMTHEFRMEMERVKRWTLLIGVPIIFVSTYATLSLLFPDMDPDQVEARRTSCESCKTK